LHSYFSFFIKTHGQAMINLFRHSEARGLCCAH